MRIGIDCRTILNPGFGENAGVGHYTYFLVKNLLKIDKKNTYILFFDHLVSLAAVKEFIGKSKNVEIKHFPFHRFKKFLPYTYSHLLVSAFIGKKELDVFHSPANILPLKYEGNSLVTMHDLAIYKHPEWFPKKTLTNQSFSTKVLVPKSLKKAKKIITVSENTKKDIIKIFKIPAKKIKVIYEGVELRKLPVLGQQVCNLDKVACWSEVKETYSLNKKYILFLGTLEPRKNLVSLIKAFKKYSDKYDEWKEYILVLAGAKGWKYNEVFKTIKKLKLQSYVKYLDYIPARHKINLMRGASCFVFPSKYEGFGLPVLEAMSLGVPVITSKISSLPEITGKVAKLINPNSVQSIVTALNQVLSNVKLQKKMKQEGLKRAKKFNWQKTAEETLKVYKEVKSK